MEPKRGENKDRETYSCVYQVQGAKPAKIENIIGDGFIELPTGTLLVRVFEIKDGRRMEVGMANTIFIFDPKRNEIIERKREEREKGK